MTDDDNGGHNMLLLLLLLLLLLVKLMMMMPPMAEVAVGARWLKNTERELLLCSSALLSRNSGQQ